MEQKRLCYISRNYYNLTSAGNKAKTDNEDTLAEMGAINLGLPRTIRNSKILSFFLDLIGILRACILLQKDDVLFLQYPVKKYFSFLCHIAHLKGARTVSLIHDLGSFRRKKLTIQKEINRLSNSDYIIASNEKMKGWLKEHGLQKPVGALGLFDYRSASRCSEEVTEREQVKVVYAGALSMKKNSFLIELSKTLSHWQLLVCGNKKVCKVAKQSSDYLPRVCIKSEEFIKHIDADFGLVWDGDSLDGCSGEYGQYLKWNSPHKVSFYLRAGLPLIIWKEAAVAPIIEEAGAGITIGSLEELDDKLANLTPEQKKEMKKQAVNLAQKLNKGGFLTKTLKEINFR